LSLWVASAAGAGIDLTEAVKRVSPATVAVEWRGQDSEDTAGAALSPWIDHHGEHVPNQTAVATVLLAEARESATGPQKPDAVILASGTVLSADGLIVTRIDGTGKGSLLVTFPDGRELPARLLVDDRRSGLHLLKVDAEGLPFVKLADEPAQVGQRVLSVMCISPRRSIVAVGIVAAANRFLPGLAPDLLQTDMGVTPMSAGAPLADVEGRLLGIIVASADEGPNQANVAFAVPATSVQALLRARRGDSTVLVYRGYLGVELRSEDKGSGRVSVENVLPDSPAKSADVRNGDEIVYVGGRKVSSPEDVVRFIRGREAGDKVTITIGRDGKEKPVEVTLGRYPAKALPSDTCAPGIWELQPGTVYPGYLLNQDGKWEYRVPGADAQQQEAVKNACEWLLRQQAATPNPYAVPPLPATPTIRVQRSDVEKRLDQLTLQVQSLRLELQDLTAQLKALQERLDADPPSEE